MAKKEDKKMYNKFPADIAHQLATGPKPDESSLGFVVDLGSARRWGRGRDAPEIFSLSEQPSLAGYEGDELAEMADISRADAAAPPIGQTRHFELRKY